MQSSGRSPQENPRGASAPRFPPRILVTGFLALLTAGASLWFIAAAATACDSLAPLTVLATLAAFLISVGFRQMSRHTDRRSRWFLFACLLVAGATLFADFRFVRRNRGFCSELQQQLRHAPNP